MTVAEKILWSEIQNNKLGIRFKPQHPIKSFIVDFYCHKAKLIIEVDGGIHTLEDNKVYDTGRTYELEQLGLKVIRFTNTQVFNNIQIVLSEIKKEVSAKI